MDDNEPLLTPSEPLLTPEDRNKRKQGRQEIDVRPKRSREEFPVETQGLKLRREDTGISETLEMASSEKYQQIKRVGVGAYGSVFMAKNEKTDEIVAIKQMSRKEDPLLGGFPLSVLREISILRSLSHDNIVKIHEVAQTPGGDPLIVMEFCQASLLELLNSRRHDLSFSEVKDITRQLLDATKHMHKRGILHRDLASKNVLFNLSGEIKVCDFGISRRAFGLDEEYGLLSAYNLENPNMIVSLPYRAIELLLGDHRYGPALDIWAVGCILGEILLCQAGKRQTFFGAVPGNQKRDELMMVEDIFRILGKPTEETWPGLSKLSLLKAYNSARLDSARKHFEKGDELHFIKKHFTSGDGSCANVKYRFTENLFDLLGGLFTLCPGDRLNAERALTHSWFSEQPLPRWHKEHWANISSEIPRGEEMRNQPREEGRTDTDQILRQLTKEELNKKKDDESQSKTAREVLREALQARALQAKQIEEAAKREEEKKKLARRPSNSAADDKLPPGWTKQWSKSKQKYYYHNSKTSCNQWEPPAVPARK